MRTSRGTDPTLEALRARLADVDRALVGALCAREEAQRAILALKLSRSLPLIEPDRERTVRQRARVWAHAAGGDADLAAAVVMAALESGKRRFLRSAAGPGAGQPDVSLPGSAPAAGPPRTRAPGPVPEVSV